MFDIQLIKQQIHTANAGHLSQYSNKCLFQDCLFIGKHCFNGGILSRSIEWFEEAWYLAGEEQNTTVTQVYRGCGTQQGRSRIQLHRYTGGVVLSKGGAEYSYTGIQGAWYSAGEQNTVTQVYRRRGTQMVSRILLHRYTGGVVLRW